MFAGKAANRIITILAPAFRFMDKQSIQRLAHVKIERARAIAGTLLSLSQVSRDAGIARIENARRDLEQREDPLADGTLGPIPEYDINQSVGQACRVSSPPIKAQLLYSLVRDLQPRTILELGTNVGISSAYLGLAAKRVGGRVLTLDVSPYRLRIAKRLHADLGLDNIAYRQGHFSDTLPAAVDAAAPIDLAFIDGHHQFEPTLRYFETVARGSNAGSVVVLDDIRWSDGMRQAWKVLSRHPRASVSVDLWRVGMCILARDAVSSRYVTRPMPFLLQ